MFHHYYKYSEIVQLNDNAKILIQHYFSAIFSVIVEKTVTNQL